MGTKSGRVHGQFHTLVGYGMKTVSPIIFSTRWMNERENLLLLVTIWPRWRSSHIVSLICNTDDSCQCRSGREAEKCSHLLPAWWSWPPSALRFGYCGPERRWDNTHTRLCFRSNVYFLWGKMTLFPCTFFNKQALHWSVLQWTLSDLLHINVLVL